MVAITVSIGAVSFLYFNGYIGGGEEEIPVFQLRMDDLNDQIIVSSAESDANWNRLALQSDTTDIYFRLNNDVTTTTGTVITGTTDIITSSDPMSATEYLDFEHDLVSADEVKITMIDTIANTELGTYTFVQITARAD